ncbi:MAG: DDE-type integrase/transposase/recombinase [Solirubrobacteraceae bacterium]
MWEVAHIAIDDCTRLAYVEVLRDEKASSAIAFLRRAVAFFERHGMAVEQLLTDNGSAYRSSVHAIACRVIGIRHLRTRAYRLQTNRKAHRSTRTLMAPTESCVLPPSSDTAVASTSESVDWSIDSRQTGLLVTNALGMALNRRAPKEGGIIHSDQGVQFASWVFSQKVTEAGLAPSVGAVGAPAMVQAL